MFGLIKKIAFAINLILPVGSTLFGAWAIYQSVTYGGQYAGIGVFFGIVVLVSSAIVIAILILSFIVRYRWVFLVVASAINLLFGSILLSMQDSYTSLYYIVGVCFISVLAYTILAGYALVYANQIRSKKSAQATILILFSVILIFLAALRVWQAIQTTNRVTIAGENSAVQLEQAQLASKQCLKTTTTVPNATIQSIQNNSKQGTQSKFSFGTATGTFQYTACQNLTIRDTLNHQLQIDKLKVGDVVNLQMAGDLIQFINVVQSK